MRLCDPSVPPYDLLAQRHDRLSLLAIVLSTTALYALMAMTVAQRQRKFG